MAFNPTMVRLLHGEVALREDVCLWFQSHNGAIAASSHRNSMALRPMVSIPQWCDCCRMFVKEGVDCADTFNPTMVRLLR